MLQNGALVFTNYVPFNSKSFVGLRVSTKWQTQVWIHAPSRFLRVFPGCNRPQDTRPLCRCTPHWPIAAHYVSFRRNQSLLIATGRVDRLSGNQSQLKSKSGLVESVSLYPQELQRTSACALLRKSALSMECSSCNQRHDQSHSHRDSLSPDTRGIDA